MTTTAELIELGHHFVPRGKPRKEAKLVEDETLPLDAYAWVIEHWYVDLDHPDLSFPYYHWLPAPCGKRKAVWLAWELGFDVLPKPQEGGGRPD